MKPINLMKADAACVKQFLDSFDHVFSDCDGVIWLSKALPGAGKFFELMRKLGKSVHFVSNNSLRTRRNYEEYFEDAGIENGYENLTIPSIAIAEYLKSVDFKKTVYSVACPQTAVTLRSNGFKCIEGPDQAPDHYSGLYQYLEDDEEIGAVVFDSDFKVNMPKLYKAITHLKRPEVIFLSGATDKYIPLPTTGGLGLGAGIFTDIVIAESKREPIQLGKPGRVFGEFAMKRANVSNAGRVLFIGDMIEQDIGLGKATGFKTLLIMTHCSEEQMMKNQKLWPDYYADSLGSLLDVLNKY
ncbi:unnamed protein product [Leptidea sinapis]|uniref:4-nitrophenylphosphatase n=1 Tax=Leptidea sinapis TaxID=189913 RepID=A0A5E4QEP9_9NEOP|nr:unnamed protein product [Leptidea sinapis]